MFKNSIPVIALPGYTVEKKFTSRKNSVYLIKREKASDMPMYLVCKKYTYPDRMATEVEMLSLMKSKGVAVPQVYWQDKEHLLLEYIEGPLLLDCYCWQEEISGSDSCCLDTAAHRLINDLCGWFKDFYNAAQSVYGKQILMGDVNFRNFILKERIYGFDLEECYEGRIEKEVGSLCAFALTYNPCFTKWKMAVIRELIGIFTYEFNLDRKLLQNDVQEKLLFLAQIRGKERELKLVLRNDLIDKIFNDNAGNS